MAKEIILYNLRDDVTDYDHGSMPRYEVKAHRFKD